MLTIKILGTGCANCKNVEAITKQVAQNLALEATFVEVTDYNILSTLGMVINEKLVCAGCIPSPTEVTT
jgi:hypothetical protein